MKIKNPNFIIAIGLLSISLANFINLVTPLPHFVRGFFVGFGAVFILWGFIVFIKQKRQTPSV